MSYEEKGSMTTTVLVTRDPDRSGNYVCDGTADDVQINAALSYLSSGGLLQLGEGTYNITANQSVSSNNITVRGMGRATILNTTASIIMFNVTGDNCRFEDFHISGNDTGANQRGIQASGVDKITIKNVSFVDQGSRSIYILGGSTEVSIEGCSFSSVVNIPIFIINTDDITIRDCFIENSGQNASYDGIHIGEASAGNDCHNVTIDNCILLGNGGDNIHVTYSTDVTISNCIMKDANTDKSNMFIGDSNASYGCSNVLVTNCVSGGTPATVGFTFENVDHFALTGCMASGSPNYDYWLFKCNDWAITGCISDTPTQDGVNIDTCVGGSITGCTIKSSGRIGIYIIDSGDDITISGNTVLGSTTACIDINDGDDVIIVGNRLRDAGAGVPIDINNAEAVRTLIMGNNWEGSTADPAAGAATNPRFTSNLDLNGAWYAVGDDPA